MYGVLAYGRERKEAPRFLGKNRWKKKSKKINERRLLNGLRGVQLLHENKMMPNVRAYERGEI